VCGWSRECRKWIPFVRVGDQEEVSDGEPSLGNSEIVQCGEGDQIRFAVLRRCSVA
jgi:hypothetical protein